MVKVALRFLICLLPLLPLDSLYATSLYQSYKVPMFNGSVQVPLVYEIDGIYPKKEGCVKVTFANLRVHEFPIGSGSFI